MREDIIKLAREAGLLTEVEAWVTPHQEAMERFFHAAYAAGAAAEREAYALAVDNMRESCANLLEANATACTNPIHRSLLQANAAEIRARGTHDER